MLKSRLGPLLVRPCSNVALLCNHDNKEMKEDVDGCVGVGGFELVHDLFSCHVSSGPLILLSYSLFMDLPGMNMLIWQGVPVQQVF